MLKNIKNNVFSLFKDLGLELKSENIKELETSIEEKRRFYTDSIDEELFLKIKLQENIKVTKDINREIGIYKVLNKRFKQKERFFPQLISYGKYKNLFWFLQKREKGKLTGEMNKDFGMKKGFLSTVSPSRIAKLIFLYQNVKPNIDLYCRGGWWYWQDFNHYKESFLDKFVNSKLNRNLLSRKDIRLAEKILEKNKKILDKEAVYLSHSDLYPNNLLFTKERKFIILDWGLVNLNNFAFDVAFIYLLAHRSKSWQENFLNTYLNHRKEKNRFKELFKIALISLTVRFAAHSHKYFIETQKKELFLIFKRHIESLKKTINSN